MRDLAATARTVAWLVADVFARLEDAERGPGGRLARRDRDLGDGVLVRDRRVAFAADAPLDGTLVLRAAAAAADLKTPFDRASLERSRGIGDVDWDVGTRDAFVALLRAGRGAVPVFEALDQAGVLTRLLPEWDRIRSLPQRNAYHRFTVDRHLLEAVAECAELLDDDGFDGNVARRARADLLLLAALLHDLGKGMDGNHSVVGADAAVRLARRIRVAEPGVATLEWLVRNHLAFNRRAVEPAPGQRNDWEIINALAAKVGTGVSGKLASGYFSVANRLGITKPSSVAELAIESFFPADAATAAALGTAKPL